jgi:hypothetical protein
MEQEQKKTSAKNVALTMEERFALMNVIPSQGNFLEVKHLEQLRLSLLPSPQEVQDKNVVADGNNVTWNPAKDQPVSFEFSGFCVDLLCRELKKLDKEHKLERKFLSLYEKLVEGV